ncbi:hypothetical protein FOA52_004101 [Chlamydomonas sp. UWO 241]|nr:hypothetical protein FOA52_004101 [Chlamydomonas sp. UWO 241]
MSAPDAKEGGPQNFARRDQLLSIQAEAQGKWKDGKVFEVDAPAEGAGTPDEKFFGTFPYPYMNGMLHLGHAFSLSKLEFASAYHRLLGKRVLFPQGFHCTGMPIKACADRLDRELTKFGNPPVFPAEEDEPSAPVEAAPAEVKTDPTKFTSKKSKAGAKKGAGSYQYQILQKSGIPDEDIPAFRDTLHWLDFFPPHAVKDIDAMGCGVDWRRSFITTDINPFYDSFVRWQFNTLKKLGKVVKDKRFAVFSPLDGQPCADHDRASGEGVGPQDYTLVKMKALELPGKLAALEGKGTVFFMAATLRPETMYGQTNCWALPDGDYVAVRGLNEEIYILAARAALNLSYQEKLPETGKVEVLLEMKGQDLMGVPLSSSNAVHERVYVLPLLTILMNKGTGVVTSVPSDSPDDYMALQDLKKKPKLREKFGILDEWVLPFDVIPIIDVPEYGNMCAVKVCEDMKIQSQNDSEKLAEAKGLVYLKGFNEGIMCAGPYAGRKVSEVKPIVRADMLAAGQAMVYSEPEKPVMSRSGDECVVALTDQWYLVYGEDEWRAITQEALNQLECYSDECKNQFQACLAWLNQWACSRSFGLGTRVPWDKDFLIESLSDSTIYMAYYTVAHVLQDVLIESLSDSTIYMADYTVAHVLQDVLIESLSDSAIFMADYTVAHVLQEGDMYCKSGSPSGTIKPEDVTDEVWDYVLLGGALPTGCGISEMTLAKMRREFEYWYPFDLRVSGKDLIQNHLSFSLYTHTAIFPKERWPRSFRTNGHLMLNSAKMAKSTGNFKTLREAIQEYSADAMRWALADAGDTMEDANFETSTANAAILRITKELAWVEESLAPGAGLREAGSPLTLPDRIFMNEITIAAVRTREMYDKMLFREALKIAAYDLGNARDTYRFATAGAEGMSREVILRYVEVSAKILSPITPHTSEHVWSNILGEAGSVLVSGWPTGLEPDYVMQRAARYVEVQIAAMRKLIIKAEAPPKSKKGPTGPAGKVIHGSVFVADKFIGWQEKTLLVLQSAFDAKAKTFAPDVNTRVIKTCSADESLAGKNEKQVKQTVLPFAKFMMETAVLEGPQVLDVKLPFDECEMLRTNLDYVKRALHLPSLTIAHVTDADAVAAAAHPIDATAAYPGNPITSFTLEAKHVA